MKPLIFSSSFLSKIILDKTNYIASQGRELGRESIIYASFAKDRDIIHNIKIGGKVLKVLDGKIEI